MSMYTEDGWIDVPYIDYYCDKHDINFVLIIGRRQVGKTYGVLKYLLDSKKKFILLRRTKAELQLIKKKTNSPFEAIDGYEDRVTLAGSEDGTMDIDLYTPKGDEGRTETIGMAAALSTIASIRGFSGKQYTDLVYDECIPEEHVYKIKAEDEAFNNAYTTINGNRELMGEKALRCWLLANSNKLNGAILKALNLVEIVERMWRTGCEELLMKDRGILILMPKSEKIIDQRRNTAIYRASGTDSKFAKMSLEGEFSHDDISDIRKVDIKQFDRICILDDIVVCKHKSDGVYYVCKKFGPLGLHEYGNTEYFRNFYRRTHPSHRAAYIRGNMFFQNVTVKEKFLKYIYE